MISDQSADIPCEEKCSRIIPASSHRPVPLLAPVQTDGESRRRSGVGGSTEEIRGTTEEMRGTTELVRGGLRIYRGGRRRSEGLSRRSEKDKGGRIRSEDSGTC